MINVSERGPRIASFWQEFLQATGRPQDQACYECFAFGMGKEMADELLTLVLDGKKRATASSVPVYQAEGTPLPEKGDISIVLDGEGTPRCVIETKAVTVVPFREVTWEMARREGEDECMESWRQGHIRFFTADMKEQGLSFTEDMPVAFEDFEVLYKA